MKQTKILSFLGLITFTFIMCEKVRIFTPVYNRPDFIEIQKRTLDAFLEDEYELIVFNDASNAHMCAEIEGMCKKLNLECFRIPQSLHTKRGHHSPGHRHMDGIKFALDTVGYNYNGIVAILDSDMFLIEPFSITKYLKGYGIAGTREGRSNNIRSVHHLSPLLVFMDMANLPNKHTLSFEGGNVEGLNCDVGGHTYYYLTNNPTVKIKWFEHLHIGAFIQHLKCKKCNNMSCSTCIQELVKRNYKDEIIKFIHACPTDPMSSLDLEFCLGTTFLHYRSGSNWRHMSSQYHQIKTNALNNLLNIILLK